MKPFFCSNYAVFGGGGGKIWPKKYSTESAVSAKRFNYHQNLGLIFIIGVHVLHPVHGQY